MDVWMDTDVKILIVLTQINYWLYWPSQEIKYLCGCQYTIVKFVWLLEIPTNYWNESNMSLINIHISFYLFHLAYRITWVLLENKFDNFQINLLIDKRTTFSVVRIEFNLDSSVSEWTGSIGSFISYFLLSPHFITTEIKV